MQRKLYIAFLIISALLTGITIIVSVQGTAGTEESLFNSTWVVFVFVAYVAIQIVGLICYRSKLSLHAIGFYLTHIGLMVFLVGCFIYYICGDKIPVTITVDQDRMYNQIQKYSENGEGEFVKLPFDVGIFEFKVDKYEDGTDKYYEALLVVEPEGTRDVLSTKLAVNKPYRIAGWKIYLMGYDGGEGATVSLLFKYDPGEYVSLSGIVMLLVGVVILCLFRKKEGCVSDAG